MSKKLHYVEQITRMLPIQRGDEFSAVDIFERSDRQIQISHQGLARFCRETLYELDAESRA